MEKKIYNTIKEKKITYNNGKPRKRSINATSITTSLLRQARTQRTTPLNRYTLTLNTKHKMLGKCYLTKQIRKSYIGGSCCEACC